MSPKEYCEECNCDISNNANMIKKGFRTFLKRIVCLFKGHFWYTSADIIRGKWLITTKCVDCDLIKEKVILK